MHRQFSKGGQGVKGNRGEAGVITVQQLQTAQPELWIRTNSCVKHKCENTLFPSFCFLYEAYIPGRPRAVVGQK